MARGELTSILKHGQIYAIANVANRGAALVLIPVYAHVLSPAQFGVYAAIAILVDLVSALLGLGLGRALVRLYVERQNDRERGEVVGTALAAFAALAAVTALAAYPLAALGTALFLDDASYAWLIAVAVWGVVFTTFVTIALNYLVVRKESGVFLGASMLKAALFIVLNLVFLLVLDWGVGGILLGTLLSSAVVAAVLLVHIARTARLGFSVPVLRELIAFGGPLVPAVFLDTAIAALDRIALGSVQGAAPLGQYGLALRLATSLQLFLTSPFLQIWGVRQLEALEREPDDATLPRIYFHFVCALSVVALGMALLAPEIVGLIASDEFAFAAAIIPLLALAQIVTALRSFAEIGIHHAKRTGLLPLVGLATLAVSVPVYFAGARLYGAVGVAAATCLIAAARLGLIAALASRHTGLLGHFPWGAFAALLALGVLVYGTASGMLAGLSGLDAVAGKLLAVALFAAAAAAPFVFEHRATFARALQRMAARPR